MGKGGQGFDGLGGDDLFAMMGMKKFSIMDADDKRKKEAEAAKQGVVVACKCDVEAATSSMVRLTVSLIPTPVPVE